MHNIKNKLDTTFVSLSQALRTLEGDAKAEADCVQKASKHGVDVNTVPHTGTVAHSHPGRYDERREKQNFEQMQV